MLDIAKLKAEMKVVEAEVRRLKAVFRESGQPNLTWRVRSSLSAEQSRATLLYSIRAHHRGRLHLKERFLREVRAEEAKARAAAEKKGLPLPEPLTDAQALAKAMEKQAKMAVPHLVDWQKKEEAAVAAE